MNNRKIRILTTIDPFWDISFYVLTQCFGQRSGEMFFLTFSTENEAINGKKQYVSIFLKERKTIDY